MEIAKILHYNCTNGTSQIVTKFIQYLIEIVIDVHQNDLPPVEPQPIPGSYYPPNGVAYYFLQQESN